MLIVRDICIDLRALAGRSRAGGAEEAGAGGRHHAGARPGPLHGGHVPTGECSPAVHLPDGTCQTASYVPPGWRDTTGSADIQLRGAVLDFSRKHVQAEVPWACYAGCYMS